MSDAQIADAKVLQKNVFRAFDEIDEMSQRYSEDIEAATEIAKEVGSSAWTIGTMVGTALLGASIVKGKFPIVKTVNWLTNLTLDAKSPIKSAINGINKVVQNSDKVTVHKFQKSIVSGKIKSFLNDSQNKAFKEAVTPLVEEFGKIGASGAMQAMTAEGGKDASAIFSELLKSHFKQRLLQNGRAIWFLSVQNCG